MPRIKRKEALNEPFIIYKDRSGKISKIVFPHPVEFGITGSSDFQGEVRFKNVDPVGKSGSRITPGGSVTSDSITSALGFTPGNPADSARANFSNVTASTGRTALGISDHVTGSLSDIFGNLTETNITTGLGFTPANTTFSNVTPSTGRTALGISDHVTGTLGQMFSNLNSSQVNTALGFTPANVSDTARSDFSNVTASTGRAALGVSDHVTGTLGQIFSNLNSSQVGSALGFTPANVANTARSDFSNVTASTGRAALGVSDHVTGTLGDMFSNLNSSQVGTALGFTPANVANTARSDFSNVTASTGRSALGVSDHVTGSLSSIFANLNSSQIGSALGFTPANVSDTIRTDLGNAPSTILNSNVTKSSLGLGNVENKSSATIRGEISSSDVTGGLGFTPANLTLSNVTAATGRSALGISDHVTGSLADVFNNLTEARVTTGLGFTPANVTGANFSSTALSNIITSGKGANGYSIDYDEVGGFDSGDNSYLLKVGASGVVGQRNINISTIYNSTSTTTITSNTTGYALTVENDSDSSVNSPDGIAITMDNALATDDTGNFIIATIRGSQHYKVASDGDGTSTVTLTFTGMHNVACLKDSDMIPGMIVECSGESWVKNTDFSGSIVSYSTCLPRVKLSSTLGSKKVFGVLALDNNKTIYEGENKVSNPNYLGVASGCFPGLVEKNGINTLDRHTEVMSLGEGCVWVTDFNGNIECGDLITSSPIKGYGCLQEDDIMRSKTVAKATEDIDWANISDTIDYNGNSYKKFLVTCTFHCG